MNDPDQFFNGESISMVINGCNVAYPNSTSCKSQEEIDAYVNKVKLNTKFITQYFNGPYYAEYHKFEYLVRYRVETDI